MNNPKIAAQARRNLDARFLEWQPAERFKPPVRGWIKAVREALGMSSAQLAKRLGIRQPTLVQIEQSEVRGTIQLQTLRRAAAAMNCTLVYALVPSESLDATVRERARTVARERLRSVEHSMLIENQSVRAEDFESRIEALIRGMNQRTLWNEP